MIITLRSYLTTLEDEERARPEKKRREIPTITALADEIGLSRVQLQRMVGGNVTSLKLDVGSRIIEAIRKRGFDMQVTDLVDYRD